MIELTKTIKLYRPRGSFLKIKCVEFQGIFHTYLIIEILLTNHFTIVTLIIWSAHFRNKLNITLAAYLILLTNRDTSSKIIIITTHCSNSRTFS